MVKETFVPSGFAAFAQRGSSIKSNELRVCIVHFFNGHIILFENLFEAFSKAGFAKNFMKPIANRKT